MANRPGTQVEKFEAFKAELRSISFGEMIEGLEVGLDDAAVRLRDAIVEVPMDKSRLVGAVYGFGLYAVAKSGIVNDDRTTRAPWQTPRWILTARDELSRRAEENPEEFGALRRAVFFHDDWRFLNNLNSLVNASVVPGGSYDSIAFAAGVATGRITSPKALESSA